MGSVKVVDVYFQRSALTILHPLADEGSNCPLAVRSGCEGEAMDADV
jgi:hypothetical protein